jgi:hypothetical protein
MMTVVEIRQMSTTTDARPAPNAEVFSAILEPGETVLWTGRPDARALFSWSDPYLIPLSVIIAIICAPNLGVSTIALGSVGVLIVLIYLLIVLFALYLLVGRFLYKRATRQCTYYAISSQRVLSVNTLWGVRSRWTPLSDIQSPRLQGNRRRGSILLADGQDVAAWGESTGLPSPSVWRTKRVPGLYDVPNAEAAMELIAGGRGHEPVA